MLIVAAAAFGFSFAVYGLLAAPFMLILLLFGIALGIISCAMVLRLGPAAEWLVWPMPAVLSPFAGVFYPLSTLPAWMQAIGHLLPASYVFEGMRSIAAGKGFDTIELLIGATIAIVQIGLAVLLFSRVHRRAIDSGLIARYSAESVT
jgi:ABC-2 type transport system permease protein